MKGKMEIQTRDENGIIIFTIKGNLTFFSKDMVYKPYNEYLEQGRTKFVFNLQDIEYIDSSGMGVILIGATKLKEERIRIVGNKRVKVIFDMLKADKFLSLFDSESEAFNSFKQKQ